MTDFILALFEQFPLQLFIAAFLFMKPLKRRRFFLLRAVGVTAVVALLYGIVERQNTLQVPQLAIDALTLLLIASVFCCVWFCYDCKFKEVLFYGTCAYAAQNFAYNLHRIFKTTIGFSYGTLSSAIFFVVSLSAVYAAAALWLVPRLKSRETARINGWRLVVNVLFLFVIASVFSPRIRSASEDELLLCCYALAGDALVLALQLGLFKESTLQWRNEMMEQLFRLEQKQQEMSKENIALINIKCHDLKKQISALRSWKDDGEREACIREMEESVMIYDSAIKTGNDTLDTLLMEKLLFCEKYKIKISCIADGAKLNFMKPFDIYSLFSNALDNAIEAVRAEADTEKRIISFDVSARGKILGIHFENYYRGNLKFRDGLPVTTKSDERYHGYGMISMRHVVEKYRGTLSVCARDNVFALNIIFPLP